MVASSEEEDEADLVLTGTGVAALMSFFFFEPSDNLRPKYDFFLGDSPPSACSAFTALVVTSLTSFGFLFFLPPNGRWNPSVEAFPDLGLSLWSSEWDEADLGFSLSSEEEEVELEDLDLDLDFSG